MNRERLGALQRAFDFIAYLVGREWVNPREVATYMGVHYRSVNRYVNAAEIAGLIEWQQGRGNRPGRLRLINERMRK